MNIVTLAARNWPFANGSGRLIDLFAKRIDLGSGERLVLTKGGFPFRVLANDLIGRHIIMTGRFDHSIVKVLLSQARSGDTLLDIGANIGYVSCCFLANVSDSKVICVEPQPGIVDLLKKNTAQFSQRATIHQVALSDRGGTMKFHVNGENRGASKISVDGEIAVLAMNAADLLCSLATLDLIKIDVEGHEEPVFRAIEGELLRLKPRAILFEDQGKSAAESGVIGSILKRCRYTVYGIDKRLFKTVMVPIKSVDHCRFNDYLAVLSD